MPRWTKFSARGTLLRFEGLLNRIFGNDLNPFYYLGALGFFFFWVLVISGAYLYIFYETGKELSYPSVEYVTNEQWYLGGVMRSLHRYASDALIVVMALHLLREFVLGRYRGARWFAWVTGLPLIWLIYAAGINGYMMPWDKLAQYATVATVGWFEWLPIFGGPLSPSFVSEEALSDRFFTLISFFHTTSPLFILFLLWIHILRISHPAVNPRRGLVVGMFLALLALALIKPALSQGPADMGIEPSNVGIDWFYLYLYPLLDIWSPGGVWAFVVGLTALLGVLPWLPSKIRQIPVAEVSLKNCIGCRNCVADCPYEAVVMRPRSDGMRFMEEAFVVQDRCVSCGICAGACPTATPYRSDAGYVSGIEMPTIQMAAFRAAMENELAVLTGDVRIMVFGCDNAADVGLLRNDEVAAISLPCIAMLPPSFVEYAFRKNHIDGVFITGCREHDCYHRLGGMWARQRLDREREPRLRGRLKDNRERVDICWASSVDAKGLALELHSFRSRLRTLNESGDLSGGNTEARERQLVAPNRER